MAGTEFHIPYLQKEGRSPLEYLQNREKVLTLSTSSFPRI